MTGVLLFIFIASMVFGLTGLVWPDVSRTLREGRWMLRRLARRIGRVKP